MDFQQDLAVNTLTILDNSGEHALLSIGNAHFKESIKVYGTAHIHNELRIGGNIIPLSNTISVGTESVPWMNLHCATANIHTLNVEHLNVINGPTGTACISDTCETGSNITCTTEITDRNEDDRDYELRKFKLIATAVNFSIVIDKRLTILDLTDLEFSHTNHNTVLVKLPTCTVTRTTKKVIVINPNNRNVMFDDTNIEYVNIASTSVYQIYEFIYIKELHNWIVSFKF